MPLPRKLVLTLASIGFVSIGSPLHAAENAERAQGPATARTMTALPVGADTYTAFIEVPSMGAAGIGQLDGGWRGGASSSLETSGGFRIWGSLLGRVLVQGDAGKDPKGRFVPSLSVVARALGDRSDGWAVGVLARYRTEGFETVEGEVEGGILGSFTQQRFHLDTGLVAGRGLEESEADSEANLRFGYDFGAAFRLGMEGRFRHELGEEQEGAAGGETGEWDAFAGAQATVAVDQFFGCLTAGPQKPRFSERIGWMAQLAVGGIAF